MTPDVQLFRSAHAAANGFSARAGFRPFDPGDAESTLGERFREVALRRDRAIAIVDGEAHISYREILQRAEAIGRELRSRSPAGGGVVAIYLPSSLATIEAMLGALLAECGYFCIDPTLPAQQKSDLLLAVVPGMLRDGYIKNGGLLKFAATVETRGPAGVAALYATSGSAGEPKIVALSHRAILFDIGRQTNDLFLGPDDRLDSLFSCAFSASLATIFGALLNGAELHCHDPRRNVSALPAWLREHRITVSTMTVSMLRHICLLGSPLASFASMRLLSVGGETLYPADVEAFRSNFPPSCELQNAMASTEARTYAQYFVPRSGPVESPVPIGWPVAGKNVRLVDESGSPVPPGNEGEIVIHSRYLADGYLNDPQRTATKFERQQDGAALYHTGDRGTLRPDGCLLFLGRTDSQAKIRGHRVELDHIAHVIGLHPQVTTATVDTSADSSGGDRLVAYVVARRNWAVSETHLRDFLRDRLPTYAIPSVIVFLPELPLNANFKVDRHNLPAPSRPTYEEGAVAAGQTIDILREIWKDVLQRSDVADDQSFAELGGDSLSAVRVLVAIYERFGLDLTSDGLERFPTLKHLAERMSSVGGDANTGSVSIFKSGGTRCPFFFVAGLGGATYDSGHLALRIDSGHSVYGLNARSRFASSPGVSVESIAANHVAEIERIVLRGRKLILVGHSFGGTIAFEIARQLRQNGFLDLLPIVIDMPALNVARRTRTRRLLDVLRNLPAWLTHEVTHLRPRALLFRAHGNLRRLVRALIGRPADDMLDPQVYFGRRNVPETYQAFLTSMYLAMRAYVPGRYGGRMILLRSRIPGLTRRTDTTMGWQAVAAGEMEVHWIPGRHDDCLSERYGAELASVLQRCADDFENPVSIPQSRGESSPLEITPHDRRRW